MKIFSLTVSQGSENTLLTGSDVTVDLDVAETDEEPRYSNTNTHKEYCIGERLLVVKHAKMHPLVITMSSPTEEVRQFEYNAGYPDSCTTPSNLELLKNDQ